jgi:hypothetical protein
MNDSDLIHAASTYGVEITSDITLDSEQNVWKFKGVNYKEAESTPKDYIAYREDGYSGIRIRQVRPRTVI